MDSLYLSQDNTIMCQSIYNPIAYAQKTCSRYN